MGWNSLKRKLKKRKRVLFAVLIVVVMASCWYGYLIFKDKSMNLKQFAEEFVAMAISALVSTFLAIWLTKNDIIENDFSVKKDKFGIITVESGYRKFFQNADSESYLKVLNFEQFFTKNNKEKIIQIVGVALRGFFTDENESLVEKLLYLCINEQYSVQIILANPYSDEVKIQSIGQNKGNEEHISKSIMSTYSKFQNAILSFDSKYAEGSFKCVEKPSIILKQKFMMQFSTSMPKALIIRAGTTIMITPYQLQQEGPSVAPTIIARDADPDGFFDQYKKYIDRLLELSTPFEKLNKNKLIKDFFTQPYGNNLSEEFYKDLRTCDSLDILGLGQKLMFTNLEVELNDILKRGGSITAVLSKPDGAATQMCVARSLIHSSLEGAISEHKSAIDILIKTKNRCNAVKRVKIYIWDCFFPYTMYAFNLNNPQKVKMYIWITNMFAYSSERDGFVIDGRFESAAVNKYKDQYLAVINAAKNSGGEVTKSLEKKKISLMSDSFTKKKRSTR